jgi:hypothetical protein
VDDGVGRDSSGPAASYNAGELWYIGEEENHEQDALGD